MSLKVDFKFDDSVTLTWDCAGIKAFIESISFLHELPKTCPVCQAPVHFFYRNPQGNSYYGLKCDGAPAHESNMGQHKPPADTLYYKGDGSWEIEFSAREGGNQGSGSAPAQPGSAAPATAPAQSSSAPPAQTAAAPAAKADITVINMIGAVARAKKVTNIDEVSKTMLNKSVHELGPEEAAALLEYLKTL